MRPLGRAKISEIVAYSKNASGSTEGHYASRFCPDIKGILGYYYVSVFAPVYAGTPVEYMTRFHTESAQMPLSIGITAHYGDMVVAKGKIASIMQNIASKVGFRVFVDRWNHLWVLPDIDHEGLWHAESDFTFDESNTYKVTITKEPA